MAGLARLETEAGTSPPARLRPAAQLGLMPTSLVLGL
jgi:hypothetical protein